MNEVVFLCGMPKEKEVIQGCFPESLVLSGEAKYHLADLIPLSCTRIVVSGLCGGLVAGIPIGGVCLASSIIDKSNHIFSCDPAWNERVVKKATDEHYTLGIVPWYSSGLLDEADTRNQRAAIHNKYKAAAIDDEARFAVAEAFRRGIACQDIRSCSDDYTETLPLAARGAIMNADGSANIGYLLSELLKEPLYQSLDLIKVGLDFATSLATLRTVLLATHDVILS